MVKQSHTFSCNSRITVHVTVKLYCLLLMQLLDCYFLNWCMESIFVFCTLCLRILPYYTHAYFNTYVHYRSYQTSQIHALFASQLSATSKCLKGMKHTTSMVNVVRLVLHSVALIISN